MQDAVLKREIESFIDKDVDELAALLAQSDSDELYSFEAARAKGEAMIAEWSESLGQAICEEWGYCERRSKMDFDDNITLAVAIADVILSAIGTAPVAIVAAILVKKGLNRFCGCGG